MIEQFNEIPKPADLKSDLPAFQSHRMHLGTFTEVCVLNFHITSIKFFSVS